MFAVAAFLSSTSVFASGEDKFDLNGVLTHHLMDSPIFELNIGGKKVYEGEKAFEHDPYRRYVFHDEKGHYKWEGGLPMHITRRVMMMFIAAFLLIVVFTAAARKITANPYKIQGKFAGVVESMVTYVREEITEKSMHHPGPGFQALVLTLFFFILFGNLMGLMPPLGEIAQFIFIGIPSAHDHTVHPIIALWPGITFTGDIAVTMTLAGITTIMTWVTGFRYQGFKFLWTVVPHGVPKAIFPLMWFLEFIVSPLARGFALTVRLLANMTAGHVIILALLGFAFMFKSYAIIPVSVVSAGIIYVLEIFVAFLQAYIFALLTALFLGSAMHRH
jgi:F-type H+-transporting ATPase subunit a